MPKKLSRLLSMSHNNPLATQLIFKAATISVSLPLHLKTLFTLNNRLRARFMISNKTILKYLHSKVILNLFKWAKISIISFYQVTVPKRSPQSIVKIIPFLMSRIWIKSKLQCQNLKKYCLAIKIKIKTNLPIRLFSISSNHAPLIKIKHKSFPPPNKTHHNPYTILVSKNYAHNKLHPKSFYRHRNKSVNLLKF